MMGAAWATTGSYVLCFSFILWFFLSKNSEIPVGKLDGFGYLLTSTLTLLMSVSTGLIKIDNVLFIQRT